LSKFFLENIRVFAYHGCFPEENAVGCWFSVDVSFDFDATEAAKNDDLTKTVDYSKIYSIVEDEMKTTSKIIENVAFRIKNSINKVFPEIENLNVGVAKLNPSIGDIAAFRVNL
jgi:dihydroneopterin aldolase